MRAAVAVRAPDATRVAVRLATGADEPALRRLLKRLVIPGEIRVTFEREQEQSIAANRMDLMVQIQRAVERIDAGTYGYCESCGRPIPKARLKAFPMATLDVGCKQREERR